MQRKTIFLALIIFSLLIFSGCGLAKAQHQHAFENKKRTLEHFLQLSHNIQELYYEEVPTTIFYASGYKVENYSRVWFKENIIKTEYITRYYKEGNLVHKEITGEIYDYNTFKTIKYCLGKNDPTSVYGSSANLSKEPRLKRPRSQTFLWYMDRINPDIHKIIEENMYKQEKFLVVEILKNNTGSTKVWISTVSGLPIKIVSNYNGHILKSEYQNIKVGEGAVPPESLTVPEKAVTF